jgi:ankyrin repeat protein
MMTITPFPFARLLLQKGASVNARDKRGKTALAGAAFSGGKEITNLLLQSGANVNAEDETGVTPLMHAASRYEGNTEVAQLLIQKGADVNAMTVGEETALMMARRAKNERMVHLLLKAGANPNPPRSPNARLLYGARHNDNKEIKDALDTGANINIKDHDGRTVLSFAAGRVSQETQHSAALLSPRDLHSQTLFVKYLLDKGANPNTKGRRHATALHEAIRLRSIRIMKLLVERGADVNAKTQDGTTPLMEVVWSPEITTIKYLLDHGARVNERNKAGETALMIAVTSWYWDTATIKYLVSRGASLNARNYKGESVLQVASKTGLWSTAQDAKKKIRLLKQLGAKY